MPRFEVVSEYTPSGDQPEAIEALASGLEMGLDEQTLLGVTGSGKTFTMAKIIERSSGPPLCWPTTRPWPPSCVPSSGSSFPTTRWSTSSPTTTTTSRRPISPTQTPSSKRIPPSTREIDRLRLSATASPDGAEGRDRGLLRLLYLRSGRAGGLRQDDGLPCGWGPPWSGTSC